MPEGYVWAQVVVFNLCLTNLIVSGNEDGKKLLLGFECYPDQRCIQNSTKHLRWSVLQI